MASIKKIKWILILVFTFNVCASTAFSVGGGATLLRAKLHTNNLIHLGYGWYGEVEYWDIHRELSSDDGPYVREDEHGAIRLYLGSVVMEREPIGRLGIEEGAQVEWLTEKTHP